MGSFGSILRVGVESTGSYGAGLLRFLQQAGVTVLEVTTPVGRIAESEAKATTSTHRAPLMPLSLASAPSHREAAMG